MICIQKGPRETQNKIHEQELSVFTARTGKMGESPMAKQALSDAAIAQNHHSNDENYHTQDARPSL